MKTIVAWVLAGVLISAGAWQVLAEDAAPAARAQGIAAAPPPPPDDAPPGDRPAPGSRPERRRDKGMGDLGDPGHMSGRGFRDDEDFKLSEEEVNQAAAILRDYRPDLADRFEAMRKSDPDHAVQMLSRFPFVRRLMMVKESDPQAYLLQLEDVKLNAEAERLAREIREGKGDDSQKKHLREVIVRQFDVRQKFREHTLKRLEEKITILREQIQKRAAARDELIASREQELIGESRNPQW